MDERGVAPNDDAILAAFRASTVAYAIPEPTEAPKSEPSSDSLADQVAAINERCAAILARRPFLNGRVTRLLARRNLDKARPAREFARTRTNTRAPRARRVRRSCASRDGPEPPPRSRPDDVDRGEAAL